MATKLEEEFFECFDIPKTELDYPDNFDPFYPEITDNMYLRLICALNETTGQILTSKYIRPLRGEILRNCIDEIRNPSKDKYGEFYFNKLLYDRVRKIFRLKKK